MKPKILNLLVLALVACSSPQKPAPQPEALVTEPAEPAAPVYEDIGPQLQSQEMMAEGEVQTGSAKAEASYCTKTHCYVSVVSEIPFNQGELSVEAKNHGVAFVVPKGAMVRFVGEVPEQFTLHYTSPPHLSIYNAMPASTAEVSVDASDATKTGDSLVTEFWAALETYYTSTPMRSFAVARAGQKAGLPPTPGRTLTDFGRVMELYSGVTSVREALQFDRGLQLRREDKATVALKDVQALELPAHPWDQMIAELATKPALEEMAQYVPVDMAYLHFHDLRDFVGLARELDEWVTPLSQAMEERGGNSHFVQAYERQLVVERTGLSEALGHVATDGVALLVGDPFLREGTDVSLMFKVRQKPALDAALSAFEAKAKARRPDMDEARFKEGDHVIRRIFTPDGDIEQNRVDVGELVIISNSRGAIRHILAAIDGKAPTLAQSGDFKYMRARYPFSKEAEDGFIFISDAFVMNAISPRTKILAGRRVEALSELQAVQSGFLMHGWFEGVAAKTTDEVVKAGHLTPQDLVHTNGQKISVDERGPRSAWGRPRLMVPLRDLSLDKVTLDEKQAYERFATTYQQYWRGVIDPIGVRINREGASIDLDARMLPIIDASDYNELREFVGTARVVPVGESGFAWVGAIGENARLRQELESVGRSFMGQKFGLGWLGDWVSIGAMERSGILDAATMVHQADAKRMQNELPAELSGVLSRLPLYLMVHLKNTAVFGGILASLKTMADDSAPGLIDWGQVEPYNEIPVVRVGTSKSGQSATGVPVALYYATVGDIWVISFEETTLHIQIDRLLSGKHPVKVVGDDLGREPAQAAFNGQFENEFLKLAFLSVLELESRRSAWSSLFLHEDLMRGQPQLKGADPEVLREASLAFLGLAPAHFHGGTYDHGKFGASHSIYGSPQRIVWPKVPVNGSPLTELVTSLRALELSLEFEGEGNHEGIRARVKVAREAN